MRYLLLSLFLVLFCSGGTRAQGNRRQPSGYTTSRQIDQIREEYATIESGLKHFNIQHREIEEGNSVTTYTGYYEKAVPRKISVNSSGERDVYVTHFYFRDGKVFFVHQITTHFRSIAANTGARSEERFYFAGGRLIRYLGDKNVVQSVDDAAARAAVKELSSLQQEALDVLKKSKS